MNLLITHEIHAVEAGGRFYNSKGVIDYDALCNYRISISDITVLVRCIKADKHENDWLRIDGEGVSVWPVPEYKSIVKTFLFLPGIAARVLRGIKHCDRYMVRLPGPTGLFVALLLWLKGKKYAVEFVGHASESFIETRKRLRFRRFYGRLFEAAIKFFVHRAHCVAHRSQYLRKLYPNKCAEKEWVFSGVQLDGVVSRPRGAEFFSAAPFKVISVGRLQDEKGHKILLEGFRMVCERSGLPVELHLVGDGPEYPQLEEEAVRLGIGHLVHFYGRVQRGPKLFSLLDEAHLFVLPSLTEGMPRSLIEAMARGLPGLGSAVGGIPELLREECLFPPGDAKAIAEKILSLVGKPEKLAALSKENFEQSKHYWPEALAAVNHSFWKEVAEYCK